MRGSSPHSSSTKQGFGQGQPPENRYCFRCDNSYDKTRGPPAGHSYATWATRASTQPPVQNSVLSAAKGAGHKPHKPSNKAGPSLLDRASPNPCNNPGSGKRGASRVGPAKRTATTLGQASGASAKQPWVGASGQQPWVGASGRQRVAGRASGHNPGSGPAGQPGGNNPGSGPAGRGQQQPWVGASRRGQPATAPVVPPALHRATP